MLRFARHAASVVFALAGVAAFAVGLWLTLFHLHRGIGPYDEGLILTDAMLMRLGQTPYRDFYVNYPPGLFQLVGLLWSLFGTTVLVPRILGVVAHVVIALVAGRLTGRLTGRRYSPLAAGLTLWWLSPLGVLPYAYVLGLALLVVALELYAIAATRGGRGFWLACGAVAALSSWFRHDLFGFFAAITAAGVAVHAVATRAWRRPEWRAALPWTVAGVVAVLAVTWIPLFARAGVMRVANDLYFDQVRHVMPARVLPFPPLFAPPKDSVIPPFLTYFYQASVVLALAGPAIGLAVARQTFATARWLPLLLVAASLAVLPQMLGRSDHIHVLYTVTPTIVFSCAWVELAPRGRTVVARVLHLAVAALLLTWLVRPAFDMVPKKWEWNPLPAPGVEYPMPQAAGAREWNRGLVDARVAILRALEKVSPPGQPIYVGMTDHRKPFISEIDLYFLYDRPGSTRYMQFDPNVVNRLDVQQAMVAELERAGTRALVLSKRFTDVREPNDSAKPGATFLDERIRERFRRELTAGPYELWVRK